LGEVRADVRWSQGKFGSAARGTMGPDSDLGRLVIKRGKFDRHRVGTADYRYLSGAIVSVNSKLLIL
jgi:hypothetical protein